MNECVLHVQCIEKEQALNNIEKLPKFELALDIVKCPSRQY